MKRRHSKSLEGWKFFIHDDGGWRWKHRLADNTLGGQATVSSQTLEAAMNDARGKGFTEDQPYKIRDL